MEYLQEYLDAGYKIIDDNLIWTIGATGDTVVITSLTLKKGKAPALKLKNYSQAKSLKLRKV